MRKVIFLDKDGTLVEDVPYNIDPQKVVLCPGVIEGMALLRNAGFEFVLVSNQEGVARACFTETELKGHMAYLCNLFTSYKVPLLTYYYCPHAVLQTKDRLVFLCACRKPWAGMLLQAAKEHGINLSRSWMIGDILNDVEAGHRAGTGAVLIDKGNETKWELGPMRIPEAVAVNFLDAAKFIACTDERRAKVRKADKVWRKADEKIRYRT